MMEEEMFLSNFELTYCEDDREDEKGDQNDRQDPNCKLPHAGNFLKVEPGNQAVRGWKI